MTTSPLPRPLALPLPPARLTGLSSSAATMDAAAVDDLAAIPDLPWLDRALCGDLPLDQLELFFVEAGRTIGAEAVAMCRRCPVRLDCLEHAYRNEITSGFFGGMSPSRRRALSHDEAVLEITAAPRSAGRG